MEPEPEGELEPEGEPELDVLLQDALGDFEPPQPQPDVLRAGVHAVPTPESAADVASGEFDRAERRAEVPAECWEPADPTLDPNLVRMMLGSPDGASEPEPAGGPPRLASQLGSEQFEISPLGRAVGIALGCIVALAPLRQSDTPRQLLQLGPNGEHLLRAGAG
jgi:hypothetical protein